MSKKIIYFLSTRNSCRSQMAEGWAKSYLQDGWDVHSAGIVADGVHPNAIKAMLEVGIDISKQTSKVIDPIILDKATLVVTLSQEVAEICTCSINLKNSKCVYWGFVDVAEDHGKDVENKCKFKELRDEIGLRIQRFGITN